MTTLLAQLAPQRSTQYGDLVSALAPYELQLSQIGAQVSEIMPVEIAGQSYLRFEMPALPTTEQSAEMGALATISATFEMVEAMEGRAGPWLRPLESAFQPLLPVEMARARRYRGKTNEVLCHFLCNLARSASRYPDRPWQELRVLDPLAGGGTILFTALMLGAEAAGVEQDEQDVRTTVAYVRQFCQEAGIACRVQEERLRKVGRRTTLTIGKSPPRRCLLAQGKTEQAAAFVAGFKPHFVITDLPYGIQHNGPLVALLTSALPVWAGLLPSGGALAYAWDATRFERSEMIALLEASAPLTVLDTPPYNQLAHRVDRVIKQRDILVARRL
jgi:predicted RNA methylase